MKTLITTLTTFATISLGATVLASDALTEPKHAVKIVKIEAELVKTPDFQAKGVQAKQMEARQWIEIEAEVEVKTSDPSGYIPSLQAEWFAIVMKENPGKEVKGQPEAYPFRLSGVSNFKDIRAKDGTVYLSAYIEPKTLERFFGDDRIRIRDFKAFALKLSGEGLMDGGRKDLCTDKAYGQMLQNWEYDYSDDAIAAKSKTPFELINIDRYPAEKEGGS